MLAENIHTPPPQRVFWFAIPSPFPPLLGKFQFSSIFYLETVPLATPLPLGISADPWWEGLAIPWNYIYQAVNKRIINAN